MADPRILRPPTPAPYQAPDPFDAFASALAEAEDAPEAEPKRLLR